MNSVTQAEQGHEEQEGETRRDFIHLLAVAGTGFAGVGVVLPAIHQMNPDASVRALATKTVDLSAVDVGQAIKVMWQGKPVFIRRRTETEIADASETPVNVLPDQLSRNENLSGSEEATDANRATTAEWMVVLGVCTHLGCVPLGTDDGDNRGDFNGWFCPCHGSHYDIAGRIRKGPAPENLGIPPYEFVSDTTLRIG